MSYLLVWSRKSKKALGGLGKREIVRIVAKMGKVAASPYRHLEKIKSEKGYKIRVGNYRMFVDVDKGKGELHVLTVRHRREAYKGK